MCLVVLYICMYFKMNYEVLISNTVFYVSDSITTQLIVVSGVCLHFYSVIQFRCSVRKTFTVSEKIILLQNFVSANKSEFDQQCLLCCEIRYILSICPIILQFLCASRRPVVLLQ